MKYFGCGDHADPYRGQHRRCSRVRETPPELRPDLDAEDQGTGADLHQSAVQGQAGHTLFVRLLNGLPVQSWKSQGADLGTAVHGWRRALRSATPKGDHQGESHQLQRDNCDDSH